MRKMMITAFILLTTFQLLSGCSLSDKKKDVKVNQDSAVLNEKDQGDNGEVSAGNYKLSQLQEDFQQFQNTIESQHPSLFTSKEELSRLFKTQQQLLKNNMGELEFYRVLSPIVSKLNCGHTSLSFSKGYGDYVYKNGNYLPLSVKIIEDRAYVYQSITGDRIPPGSEILSINDRAIKDILRIFLDNLTADGSNTSRKYYVMNEAFSNFYFNYIEAPKEFTISYINSTDGKNQKITVSAISKEQLDSAAKREQAVKGHSSEKYYDELEKDYAVLTVKTFSFYDESSRDKFKVFVDDFFARVESQQISNLILDLRGNWGGDPFSSAHLFSYLIGKENPYFSEEAGGIYTSLTRPIAPAKNNFKGKLYTLINGASFSSTGHLCALLKYHKIGTFIGTESAGSFICIDSSKDMVLKNTGLRLHYSTRSWKVAVSGMTLGRGILPDHPVTPTIQDYLSHQNVEKAFAIDLIKKGN